MNIKEYKLVYNKPANNNYEDWENLALPLGNGKIGAKVFGIIGNERIQYNEKSLWSGGPKRGDTNYYGGNLKGKFKAISKIRKDLDKGKFEEAKQLAESELIGPNNEYYGKYLSFGDLLFNFYNEMEDQRDIKNYKRELDINNAICRTHFTINGTAVTREVFTNYPDNVLVINIKYEGEVPLDFSLRSQLTEDLMVIDAPNGLMEEKPDVKLYYSSEESNYKKATFSYDDNSITMVGNVIDNDLNFASHLKIETDGSCCQKKGFLEIKNATYAVIVLAAETDYAQNPNEDYREYKDLLQIVKNRVENALGMGYKTLKDNHIDDYKNLFNRLSLNISDKVTDKYTDRLLDDYRLNKDLYLEELFFQYGRYLLIASSRPGKNVLPANLQGIWNAVDNPPWNSDYHLNINTQMIYWPVYPSNLAELGEPLINFVDDLRYYGRIAAKEYADIESKKSEENGWLVHTQVTPFGWTTPGWDFYWGWSPTANAWIVQNVYEHYRFTKDYNVLKNTIYSIVRETASFWNQFLHFDSKNNRYVSSPSFSPEHGNITVGNTYDQSLIWQLFNDFLEASNVLQINDELVTSIQDKIKLLNPIQINKSGYIKEWYEEDDPDFKITNVQNNHRHISHLVGLFPGDLFAKASKKEIEAAKKVLNQRGDGGTGWSKANKINLWARLCDGDRAHKLLYEQLCDSTLDNLWDSHPPFQLDGNMGALNGMCEMLLQSHKGKLQILPALPQSWENGEVKGLVGRGNIEVDISWDNCQLNYLKIKLSLDEDVIIEYPNISLYRIFDKNNKLIRPVVVDKDLIIIKPNCLDEFIIRKEV